MISGGTPPPAVTPIEIPVAEVPPETETAESKPESEFDSQIPIDPASYNALAARYNELRKKAVKEKNDSKLTRLGSLPIGKIINAAWPNGDTVEARIAYHEISKLLDELENSPTSPSEETVAEETPTQEAPEPGREDIKLPLAEDENLRKALEQLENAS